MTHIQELFIANLRFYRVQNGFSQLSFSEAIDISGSVAKHHGNTQNHAVSTFFRNSCHAE